MNIRGDVTSFSEIALKDSYQKAVDQNTRKIILNFEKAANIKGGGIELLINIMYQIRDNRQADAITGLSDHFKKIYNMSDLSNSMESLIQ